MLMPLPDNGHEFHAVSLHKGSRREWVAFLFRYWRQLGVAFVLPLLIALTMLVFVQPLYTATSVVLVQMGAEHIFQPESNLSPTATQQALPVPQQQIFKTEVAILDSADVHRAALNKVGIEVLYPSVVRPSLLKSILGSSVPDVDAMQAIALDRFNQNFDVRVQKDSGVLTLIYRHPDALVAQRTLVALLEAYREARPRHFARKEGAATKNAADAAYRRMEEAERAIAAYKRDHAIYAVGEEQATLMRARAELERRQLNINSPALEENLVDVDSKLARLRDAQHDLAALEHAAKVARDEYAILLNRVDQTVLQASLVGDANNSVRIVQAPTVAGDSKSSRGTIVMLGCVLALISCAVVAAIIDYRRATFSSPEDVERMLGLKVLASLPLKSHPRQSGCP